MYLWYKLRRFETFIFYDKPQTVFKFVILIPD